MNDPVLLTLGLAVLSFICGALGAWAMRKPAPPPDHRPPLVAKIKRGKMGKWRFTLEHEGITLAVSAVKGESTADAVVGILRLLANRNIEPTIIGSKE